MTSMDSLRGKEDHIMQARINDVRTELCFLLPSCELLPFMTSSFSTRRCCQLPISSTLLFLDKPCRRACLIWVISLPQVRASQYLAALLITGDASHQGPYMPHSRAGLKLAALSTLPPKTSISEVLPAFVAVQR